jgi:predicted DNA-binding transcriptional regulator AlpA
VSENLENFAAFLNLLNKTPPRHHAPHDENLENIVDLLNEIKTKLDTPRNEAITVNVEGVAEMFGKAYSTGFKIVRAPDFPAPIYQPGIICRCWLREDVIKWAKRQKLLRGRA